MISITAQTSHFYTQTIDFSSTTYLRSNEKFFLIVAEKRLNLILTFYLSLFDLKSEFGKGVACTFRSITRHKAFWGKKKQSSGCSWSNMKTTKITISDDLWNQRAGPLNQVQHPWKKNMSLFIWIWFNEKNVPIPVRWLYLHQGPSATQTIVGPDPNLPYSEDFYMNCTNLLAKKVQLKFLKLRQSFRRVWTKWICKTQLPRILRH